MEILIGVVVLFILYKIFFGKGAKKKTHDAVIGAAARLGVPESDANRILDTNMSHLSQLLAATALSQCTISNQPVHERMAYCIKIIYDNLASPSNAKSQQNQFPTKSHAFDLSQNAPRQTPSNTVITNYDEGYSLISSSPTAKVPSVVPIPLPFGSSVSEQKSSDLASSSTLQAPTAQLNTAAPKLNNTVSQRILLMEEMEEVIYERIGAELESNTLDKGVWTKAYASTGGDDINTRVVYIKLRFEKLLRIEQSKLAVEKSNQEEKIRQEIERHQQQIEQERHQQSTLIPHEMSATPDTKLDSLSTISATRFLNFIRYGHTQKVLQMLRMNPSLVSVQDNSALLIAVSENHVHLARVLIEAGAEFSPTDFANVRIKEFLEKNQIALNQ